jgi:S1-C subfamily serine protease
MAMRIVMAAVMITTVLMLPAFGEDLTDTLLTVVQRELADARVADAPTVEGRRSPIGPQLYRRIVDSVLLVVTKDTLGSGVMITPKGHILTNRHVVGDYEVVGIVAKTPDLLRGIERLRKEHVVLARVVATDPRRDLAILYIPTVPAGFRSAPLAQAGGVEVGQDVYAIGHPKGLLWTYAEGVVSQIRQDFQWTDGQGGAFQATVIQTQTPMHTGNSGGALFDGDGRVVGVNSAQKDPTLNFAIAISEVRDWIQSLAKR